MKSPGFGRQYNQLTAEERAYLVLAATVRRDEVEVARLGYSCPAAQDREFRELLDRMRDLGMWLQPAWLDVSHRVVRARLGETVWSQIASLHEALLRLAPPGFKNKMKILVRDDHKKRVGAEAQCKEWSASWKGIEAAITRFCAERGLTTQQLFALAPPLPVAVAIDEARKLLDADVPADPGMEDVIYQGLSRMSPGQNASGRG